MGRQHQSQKRKSGRAAPRHKANAAAKAQARARAVDIVTGKATVEYFFDPCLLMKSKKTDKIPSNQQDPLFLASPHLFVPCTIVKPLDGEHEGHGQPCPAPALVKTSDGVLHKVTDTTRLTALVAPDDYVGCDDVLHLPQISEASLLHTLRTRFQRHDIYTAAGPILISVNPYMDVVTDDGDNLYSEEQMLVHRTHASDLHRERHPHLFLVANAAYNALIDSVHAAARASHFDADDPVLLLEYQVRPGAVRNQSIVISGESGAGKTEATKIIMRYFARITRRADGGARAAADGRMVEALEDKVLSSNPLLEAFGNAKTLRNDNSSRFGKFIHIFFNTDTGSITGASISNYLLEKTRITQQAKGERNYHIFYQLLLGGDQDLLEYLGLDGSHSKFNYLVDSAAATSSSDAAAFEETVHCLTSLGLSQEEQRSVFGMVAAVLHLGNLQFEVKEGDSDSACISQESRPSLLKACALLGIDETKMSEAILTKNLLVDGTLIKKEQNVILAADKRDALAKLTYSSLFLWLVQRVNGTLDAASHGSGSSNLPRHGQGFIGVLDIYGFECFEANGFEQLMINYCNEKLQRHFNRHLFEVEQQLYAVEGVDWSYITFNDNRECLELIEGGDGVVGILNTLDDAWSGMGSASEKDTKFVAQLHKRFGTVPSSQTNKQSKMNEPGMSTTHRNFKTPKIGTDKQFIIQHYAGEVWYTAEGFNEKNMDTLSTELRGLGVDASVKLVNEVYACAYTPASTGSQRNSIRGTSISSQFRNSLHSLVEELERTQPHYVRCIRPNRNKAAELFEAGEVLRQLRCSGMMEAIRIRREGYAFREEHESFFNRFRVLVTDRDLIGDEPRIVLLARALSTYLHVTGSDWQIGHSKVFLRKELAEKLDRFAKLRVHVAARTLTRFGRAIVIKRASRLLGYWMKFRLHMLRSNRQHAAATRLSSVARRHRCQKKYALIKRSIISIQARQRSKLAAYRVKKMRDPFFDLTFQDCTKLLTLKQEELKRAVAFDDFHQAAMLDAEVESIKAAVESKRPFTRSILESKITEVHAELDEAMRQKDFKRCSHLQDALESLVAKREFLPSVSELQDKIRRLETEISTAAKSRDFEAAASYQTQLAETKQLMNDCLLAEDVNANLESLNDHSNMIACESRAQLEQEIDSLSLQINNFDPVQDYQIIEALRKRLVEAQKMRSKLPSAEEIRAQLLMTKEKLEAALAKADFMRASELQDSVSELERRLRREEEDAELMPSHVKVRVGGQDIIINSRATLENKIAEVSDMISASVAIKDFVNAGILQKDVDTMLEVRRFFPTRLELNDQLQRLEKQMNDAVSQKAFALAEELKLKVVSVEKKLEEQGGWDAEIDSSSNVQPLVSPQSSTQVFAPKSHPDTPKSPSEARSVHSAAGKNKTGAMTSSTSVSSGFVKSSKTVQRLRPTKAVSCIRSASVATVAEMLSTKRANCCIILEADNTLAGIITDTDFTRRVAADLKLDPETTPISFVMTENPTCVSLSDPAMDALSIMLENHFRHLPVIDAEGSVVGILDISKCLNEAVAKLESIDNKNACTASAAIQQIAQGKTVGKPEAVHDLLSRLLTQATGGKTIPSLRSLLQGRPSTIVKPSASVREAGLRMAENRHAALIVDGGRLIGIFGFKDMMTRAVAKRIPLDTTPISDVMTPDPEFISPDMTVLDALQVMADHNFLSLPVVEDDGRVIGLVDVLDVIYGCGGTDGWRSIFNNAMEAEDVFSEVSSVTSLPKSITPGQTAIEAMAGQGSDEYQTATLKQDELKTVAKLRPSKVHLSLTSESVVSVAQLLQRKRSDASLVVDSEGALAGIVTDTDFTRRLVAKHLDPATTSISAIITTDPMCVSLDDPAMEALECMIENHFRHLPVVDADGAVVGLLDIGKCLNAAIAKLERAGNKSSAATDGLIQQLGINNTTDLAHAAVLQTVLETLLSQANGGHEIPTLARILRGKPTTIVSPSTSIREAGMRMAESRHAALIVDNGKLLGIFGFKDMMTRALAMELPLDTTPVSEVMTREPEFVSPDLTVLDALRTMYDYKILTLPVVDTNGVVIGLVDVMDVIYGCGGSAGWRSIFSSAMDLEDCSSRGASRNGSQSRLDTTFMSNIPSHIPTTLEFEEDKSFAGSTLGDPGRSTNKLADHTDEYSRSTTTNTSIFKVTDPHGHTHRIKCPPSFSLLLDSVAEKANIPRNRLQLQYTDDEGDTVNITGDDDVSEAWDLARQSGTVIKLVAKHVEAPGFSGLSLDDHAWLGLLGAGGLLAIIGLTWLTSRKAQRS